jgi:hypothetical protein
MHTGVFLYVWQSYSVFIVNSKHLLTLYNTYAIMTKNTISVI